MSSRARLLAVLSLVAGVVAALLSVAPPATAEQRCTLVAVTGPDGSVHYEKKCVDVDPGNPGRGGGNGGAPPCETDRMQAPGPWFCGGASGLGTAVCRISTPYPNFPIPPTVAPPGQQYEFLECWPCNGCLGPPLPQWVLTGAQARPLIVQAQEAYGNLAPPAGTVRHSPTARAIVNLDTWLWLDPGTFGELRGTSAEGLVAVAEPDGTVWRPGDGATLACAGAGKPYAPGATGGCTHTYARSSPRYDGTVTRRWVVHYENNGSEVDIPGAPLELTADTGFALAVAETQVVTGGR